MRIEEHEQDLQTALTTALTEDKAGTLTIIEQVITESLPDMVTREYLRGFMDATGYNEQDATEQISAMSYDVGVTYEEGYADGREMLKIWDNQ